MVAVPDPLPTKVFARPLGEGASLSAIMIGIVAAVVAADCAWAAIRHFDIDLVAYARLAVLSALLWAGSIFYGRVRKAPPIAAMLFGTAFLIAFSAGFSVLNYFLLTEWSGKNFANGREGPDRLSVLSCGNGGSCGLVRPQPATSSGTQSCSPPRRSRAVTTSWMSPEDLPSPPLPW